MPTERQRRLRSRLRSASVVAGVVAALNGVAALVGRLLGATPSRWPVLTVTEVDTAILLVLAGVSLVLLREGAGSGSRRAARAGAVAVALGALLELARHAVGWNLGPDSLLWMTQAPGSPTGRMAIATVLSFLLVAVALLTLDREARRGRRTAQVAGLFVCLLALLSVISTVYGVPPLHTLGFHMRTALPTAVAFLVLGAGVLVARPEHGLTAILISEGPWGLATRRLLPATIALPPILGWLMLEGVRRGIYGIEFGVATVAFWSIVLFSAIVWRSAAPLERLDAERRRSREELEVAETRFRGLLDAAPDAIIGADRDGRIVLVNRQAEAVFGYSREELLGQPEELLLPERSRRRHPELRRAYLAEARPRPMGAGIDRFARRRDGSEFPVEITLSPFPTEMGPGAMGIVRDMSERHRAVEALRESEERFRATFEQAAVGIAHRAQDGRFLRVNRRYGEIVGYTPEEMTTLTFQEITHPEDLQADLALVAKLVAGEIPTYSMEKRYLQKDGRPVWVNLTVSLVRRPSGEPHYFIAVVEDITRRKRMEEERARLSRAVEQSPASILMTDTRGSIFFVNPAFERLSGYTRDEILGQNPRILKSGKHDTSFYRELWATLTRGETWRGRMVNRRKDGSLFEAESTVSPLRNGSTEIVAYVAAMRDITHERHMEDQLLQLQKMEMVGQLAGGVAHDFNNLLLVIDGHSRRLLRELGPEHPAHPRVRHIQEAGERGASLTRQLLAFSRKQVLEMKELDINAVVSGVEDMLRRLIGEDIELVTELAPDSPRVRADRGQLEQVIINLAVNARDAMPGGGRLTIETSTVDRVPARQTVQADPLRKPHVVLKASDTGHGMDPDTLSRIFEPFFTTKELGKGTGLGLSTVYGIVTQSGGRVDVDSEPGRGTTFRVLLPRVEWPGQESPAAGPVAAPAAGGGETILLVEDDASLRAVIREVLEDEGYRVLEASSSEEALGGVASAPGAFDIVLTDIVMRRMGGRADVERLRAAHPKAKVLFMSGYTEEAARLSKGPGTGVHFIAKPFTPSALLRSLQELLSQTDADHA